MIGILTLFSKALVQSQVAAVLQDRHWKLSFIIKEEAENGRSLAFPFTLLEPLSYFFFRSYVEGKLKFPDVTSLKTFKEIKENIREWSSGKIKSLSFRWDNVDIIEIDAYNSSFPQELLHRGFT
jgi:hypothetical protein